MKTKLEFFIVYVSLITIFIASCNIDYISINKNIEIFNVVKTKFIDKDNHLNNDLIFGDGSKTTIDCYMKNDTNVYNMIEPGDSIVKRKGELSMFVYKKNGKVIECLYSDPDDFVYSNDGKKLKRLKRIGGTIYYE